MSTASGWKALASHPRSKSKLTRTPWIVVILNSIVQSRSYPWSDPREAACWLLHCSGGPDATSEMLLA